MQRLAFVVSNAYIINSFECLHPIIFGVTIEGGPYKALKDKLTNIAGSQTAEISKERNVRYQCSEEDENDE